MGCRSLRSYGPLNTCAGHFIHLNRPQYCHPRLQWLIIYSIGVLGYDGFKEGDVKAFIALLDNLHVDVEELEWGNLWINLPPDVILSSEAPQDWPTWYSFRVN